MTNSNCKVDFIAREIRVTKSFYKAAQIPDTNEFCKMIELQAKLPGYIIVFQDRPITAKKIWYPTYSQMVDYVKSVTNEDKDALAELHDAIMIARMTGEGYNMVRRWFFDRYGDMSISQEMNFEVA